MGLSIGRLIKALVFESCLCRVAIVVDDLTMPYESGREFQLTCVHYDHKQNPAFRFAVFLPGTYLCTAGFNSTVFIGGVISNAVC